MPDRKTPADTTGNALADVRALVRRAEKGDESVLPDLRRVMDDGGLVESVGNLAVQVEGTLTRNAAGDNLVFKEALSSTDADF